MISSARRARLGGCRFRVISRSRPQCRVGDFARRFGLAASQGFRDDASTAARRRRFGAQSTKCRLLARRLSPTKHRARLCRAIFTASRQYTPPSAPFGASTSPCRGGFANGFHPKGSPVRGAVGISRLRGAAHDLANTLPVCLTPPRPCGAALTQNHSAPFATLPGGRERPPYNITYTGNGAGSGSPPPA